MTYAIGSPTSGQPVSRSQFGLPVISAINDLDERIETSQPGGVRCKAFFSAATLSLTSNVLTAVPLASEAYDPLGMHDTASNNSRITVPEDGCYQIIAKASFAANATGRRFVGVWKNALGNPAGGVPIGQTSLAGNGSTDHQQVTTVDVELAANDVLEMFVLQNTAGALNLVGATEEITHLSVRLVDRA